MFSHVSIIRCFLSKSFVTNITPKSKISCVDWHVAVQILLICKCLGAFWAWKFATSGCCLFWLDAFFKHFVHLYPNIMPHPFTLVSQELTVYNLQNKGKKSCDPGIQTFLK